MQNKTIIHTTWNMEYDMTFNFPSPATHCIPFPLSPPYVAGQTLSYILRLIHISLFNSPPRPQLHERRCTADLEDLAAGGLVAVVPHVVAVVGRRRPQAEHVAEDADDPQQALHLSLEAAGEAGRGGNVCVSVKCRPPPPPQWGW